MTLTTKKEEEEEKGGGAVCLGAPINFQFSDCLLCGTLLNWKHSEPAKVKRCTPVDSIDEFDLLDAVGKVAVHGPLSHELISRFMNYELVWCVRSRLLFSNFIA